jgi:hypothetical protein
LEQLGLIGLFEVAELAGVSPAAVAQKGEQKRVNRDNYESI